MPYKALQEAIAAVNWSNWALVLVGGVGVCAALLTLKAISKQTTLFRESAEAAHKSAVAAIENLTAFKNKERARIRIEPGLVSVHPPEKKYATNGAAYKVFCLGATHASVVDSALVAKITTSQDLISEPELTRPIDIGSVVEPSTAGIEKRISIVDQPGGNIQEGLNNGSMFLHFKGFVRYKDVFDSEHITRFRYIYGNPRGIFIPALSAYWKKCGSDEENQET